MKLTNKQKASAFAALRRMLKGPHWEALNERRGQLIDADADTPELDALQELASLRRMTLAPYPAPRRSNAGSEPCGREIQPVGDSPTKDGR